MPIFSTEGLFTQKRIHQKTVKVFSRPTIYTIISPGPASEWRKAAPLYMYADICEKRYLTLISKVYKQIHAHIKMLNCSFKRSKSSWAVTLSLSGHLCSEPHEFQLYPIQSHFWRVSLFLCFHPLLSPQVTSRRGPAGRALEPRAGKQSAKTNVSLRFRLFIEHQWHVVQPKWSRIFVKRKKKNGSSRRRRLVRVKRDGMSFWLNRHMWAIKA